MVEVVTVEPPRTVSLTVLQEPRDLDVVGDLISFDPTGCDIVVRGEPRRYAWSELSPVSCFTARYRLVDETSADDWFELAAFGRRVGAEQLADYAAERGLEVDPSRQADADALAEIPLNEYRSGALLGGTDSKAESAATEAAQTLTLRLRTFNTPHFQVFTDWAPSKDQRLAQELEAAHERLCREFGVAPGEPFFEEPLPVYMFHSHGTFLRYAREIDGFASARGTVAGYYTGDRSGRGKIVMSSPRDGQLIGYELAEQQWRRTLTHEFSHAFLARYEGGEFLPRWFEEGLAEMIADKVHARPGAIDKARNRALTGTSIAELFDPDYTPTAAEYPVMMSLVIGLYQEDPKRFRQFVKRLKAGEQEVDLLQELYGVDHAGLEEAWRGFMRRN